MIIRILDGILIFAGVAALIVATVYRKAIVAAESSFFLWAILVISVAIIGCGLGDLAAQEWRH